MGKDEDGLDVYQEVALAGLGVVGGAYLEKRGMVGFEGTMSSDQITFLKL